MLNGLHATAVALLLAASAAAAGAASPSLRVTPSSVPQGGSVRITGVAPGCAAGNEVFVISRAFSRAHEFAGVPAAIAKVRAGGRFSTSARIPRSRAPGNYAVTARCGGGNLGVSKTLTVRRA
jgi:hypothetical protein